VWLSRSIGLLGLAEQFQCGAEPLDLSIEPRGFIQCRLVTLLRASR
jgi:hypothetical protein